MVSRSTLFFFLACNVDNCEKCLSDDAAKCETCKSGFKLDNDACNGKSTVSFNYVIAIVQQRNSKSVKIFCFHFIMTLLQLCKI